MRIMQISNSHNDYLNLFQKRNKKKRSYAERMQAYIEDYYWASHTLTPALARMGHETFFCVPTETESQRIWCEENRVPWHEEAPLLACLEQVARFQPDVLYIGSASIYHDAFLAHLPYRPKLVVAWHATLTWDHMRLSNYDLILSSHAQCLQISRQQGVKNVAFSYPGFPAELAQAFSPTKHTDLCFSGYWAISHPCRNAMLAQLAEKLPQMDVTCAYHLGFYDQGPQCPESVHRYNRGPVWGRSMFKAFAASHITLNAFCNLNNGPQTLSPNMRQLEATGVGSLLLTEKSPNMEAFFTPDVDLVTFADTEELIEKALYYLEHKDALQAIAAQGQATCLHHYNMDVRAKAFMDRVNEHLHSPTALPFENTLRTLTALQGAHQNNPEVMRNPDMQSLLQTALISTLQQYYAAQPEKADLLLAVLEKLLPKENKNLHYCQALRCIQQGDTQQAEQLLRAELISYPENDPARQQLSELVYQKNNAEVV